MARVMLAIWAGAWAAVLAAVSPITTSAGSLSRERVEIVRVDAPLDGTCMIGALLTDGDTAYLTCGAGMWVKTAEKDWERVVGCIPRVDWWEDCDKIREFPNLYEPGGIWQLPESGDVVVFEDYCGCFLRVETTSDRGNVLRKWTEAKGRQYFESANVQQELVLCGIYSEGKGLIAVANAGDVDDYKTVLQFEPSLKRHLDSMGLNYAYCRPAFNPNDSSIWISVWGYEYIYITDMDGRMLDSIHISAQDYVTPSPPISRVKSKAVWNHWLAQWTPGKVFRYVPPGYFVLQYQVGWEPVENDSLPLYSTAVWSDDKRVVDLEVDPRLQLAGVQSDGRIIFGRYVVDDTGYRIELIVARMEQ